MSSAQAGNQQLSPASFATSFVAMGQCLAMIEPMVLAPAFERVITPEGVGVGV